MQTVNVDIAIVGAGGGGLRAAIAAAEANPNLKIALVSKVYPMRSHTVAAEGGAAAVIKEEDSYDKHFHDTVAGGDWLCEQDVVEYFVEHSPVEMTQLERWGCPWSRKADGDVNVRRFRWDENRTYLVRGRQNRFPLITYSFPNIHSISTNSTFLTNTSF